MLIFDQLKKSDLPMRTVAVVILTGLGILLAGLWWVQIVSARDYQESLETQSFRTVRIPAVRGKILDRNGAVLAENRPSYNVSLYLDELRKAFEEAYAQELTRVRAQLRRQGEAEQRKLGRDLTRAERAPFLLSASQKEQVRQSARYQVASNVVRQVSSRLGQPLVLNPTLFERHYQTRLALPLTIVANLDPASIGRFEEQTTTPSAVDIEVQSTRVYPQQTIAAHVLGRLKRDDSAAEGEEAYFSYWMPDFRGVVGIEAGFDKELRGMAGGKSVLVNNLGYRQTETVWRPAEPGHNVVLTIDLDIQREAERALQAARIKDPPPVRGAVVVLDVRDGDILAMASSPTLNPNAFVPSISREEYRRISELGAEKNRATQENYMPGSIFKMVVGMAALEAGWNPKEIVTVAENPAQPGKGHFMLGKRSIRDTAPPGEYDFRRALKLSCNSYFITLGLRIGPERIIRLAQRVHFGERAGLPTWQDAPGQLPDLKRLNSGWSDGNTANISIGADPVWVTPLQVAVLTAAVANGGHVLWPRLVDRIEPQDSTTGEAPEAFPPQPPRDELGVSSHTLSILHDAMLADTEDPDGTGHHARDAVRAEFPTLRICGKTGTAQVQDDTNKKTGQTTWFASFAPYGSPRYAVVVMVEDGISGGETCSRVAGSIYKAIMQRERGAPGKPGALARAP